MRSIRLDDELDSRVRQAAATEGASVSEFIRRAASERADHTLANSARERLADVIGTVHGGGGQARDTGTAFVKSLNQRA
jgi:predicted DNA-binding protein